MSFSSDNDLHFRSAYKFLSASESQFKNVKSNFWKLKNGLKIIFETAENHKIRL